MGFFLYCKVLVIWWQSFISFRETTSCFEWLPPVLEEWQKWGHSEQWCSVWPHRQTGLPAAAVHRQRVTFSQNHCPDGVESDTGLGADAEGQDHEGHQHRSYHLGVKGHGWGKKQEKIELQWKSVTVDENRWWLSGQV